ncbi:MAG TPA: TPM domain-containing protein, partial [Thermoanaerobaculia bacterium]
MRRSPRAAVLALVLALLAAAAAAKEVPYLSGRVVDEAGIVPPDAAARIEETLRAFEEETGAQVAVLTVPSLEGEVLEDYSLKVAETWGLGREDRDDGVLLLVARDDRQLRIEVGYGLEGALTDAEAGRIVRNVIVPRFKAGDYGGGIEAGVDAVVGTLRGEEGLIPEDSGPVEGAPDSLGARVGMGAIFFVVVGLFSVIALFGKGCQSWFLYVFLIPFWTAFPLAIFGAGGAVLGLLWIVLFPLLRLVLDRSPRGKRLVRTTPWLHGLSTWAATSSSRGGGFGGGGFSGGGGSFGG